MNQEFMLLIYNKTNEKENWPAERHTAFLKACENYISDLQKNNMLLAAQPLVREGICLSMQEEGWSLAPLNKNTEIQAGYYHIVANDFDEAVAIAKKNPEFEFVKNVHIEIRPVKTKEKDTGFEYPKN